MLELRDYQRECVEALDGLDGGSHLVVMATGLGKTVTFSRIRRRGRVLILSHRDELVHQPIRYYDVPVGVEMASERSHGEEVVSASVQTLSRRIESTFRPGDFDTIITDEAHHAAAPSYTRIYDYLRPRLHLGFTATPRRGDDRGLAGVFDDIVFRRDLLWGIRHGYLCDVDCRRVSVSWSTSRVGRVAGDFNAAQLALAVNNLTANEQVAEAYRQLRIGRTLIFASSLDHAHEISALIPGSFVISGATPRPERQDLLARFEAGDVECLVNYGVFTEGLDVPGIETVLLARPTRNATLYTQMVGRGLRRFTDPSTGREKRSLRLIDCVGVSDDKSLCTLPTLVGMNERDFPSRARGVVDGSLAGLRERVREAEDTPAGWVLRVRRVDALSTVNGLAWVTFGDGTRHLSGRGWEVSMSKPDLVDRCEVRYQGRSVTLVEYDSPEAAEVAVRRWLETNPVTRDQPYMWDMAEVAKWGCGPATAKQLSLIGRLLGDEASEIDGEPITKREAQAVIETAIRKQEQRNAETYGVCERCGRALVPSRSGKTLQCCTNRWERDSWGYRLVAGCGWSKSAGRQG